VFTPFLPKRQALDRVIPNAYAPQVNGSFHGVGFQEFDVEAVRTRIQKMTDEELIAFGKRMRELVYPITYGFNGKPTVSAFSIQLAEAREEWRRRHLMDIRKV
jgi:hypothetical protein